MSLTLPKDTTPDFENPPAGTFVATCYRVVDLGTQQIEWQGKAKHQYKIMVSWELTDEKMSDGRPFTTHKRYTLSSSEKSSLRQDLEAWRGQPFQESDFGTFDIGVLLGKPCMIGIVHEQKNGKTYANVSSILRMPKGMTAPVLVNPTVRFDLTEFNQDIFNGLSESLQAVIAKSPEYQELKGGAKLEQSLPESAGFPTLPDSEIPF